MDRKLVLRGALIVLVVVSLFATGVYHTMDSDGENEVYTVKTQQVQDTDTVNDSAVVSFDELHENNQEALHRAFKEEDHFWGSASIDVRFDHEIEGISGWKLVSIDGAYMLVSIQHQRTAPQTEAFGWTMFTFAFMPIIGGFAALYGLAAIGAGLEGGRSARRFRRGY